VGVNNVPDVAAIEDAERVVDGLLILDRATAAGAARNGPGDFFVSAVRSPTRSVTSSLAP
jgi:hypothetical protein